MYQEATMTQLSITPEAFALSGSLPPQAVLLWGWNYTASGVTADGTFVSSSQADTSGYYQISGITGSRNGVPIVSLEPAGDAIPGNEGFPVDNLINASGLLTANGFGYETSDGNFANPFYADFLNPPIFEEVTTQPAFSEIPVEFEASRVPGLTIATSAPSQPGDALKLTLIQAPRSGSVSLFGTSVQYVPAGKDPRFPVKFSFRLEDQSGNTTPLVTVIVAGNGSHDLNGAASGHTDISVGNGNNHITLSGSGNTVTFGSGIDTVHGGNGDTINIAGNAKLTLYGANEMVFAGDGNATIDDRSTGLRLEV
jgi:hypothetical protein